MKKANISFLTSDRLNTRFDEVINCSADSRFSDQGFVDQAKIMIGPRIGSEIISRAPPSLGSVKDAFWFTDDNGVKTGYISKGAEVFKVTYKTPGRYLGTFESLIAASIVPAGFNGDYFIAAKKLYVYLGGLAIDSGNVYTSKYDNEADLFIDFPTPEDDLFAFLVDTQSVYVSTGGKWNPYAEFYTMTGLGLAYNPDHPYTFNTVTLPTGAGLNGTSSLDATAIERLNAGGLVSPASYVGSYVMITSGPYTGKYAYIFDYKASEFILVSIGNATPLLNGTTFTLFSKKGRYIQMTNGRSDDRYYDGTHFELAFQGKVNQHISKFANFPEGGPGIIRTYGNYCFTNIGDSVFISDAAQPLWFNINDSIDLQKSSGVDDYFIWKNRMIAYGNNFTSFIDPSVGTGANRTTDFKNYGIVPGSCAEVLGDFWFLSYSGQIIPLSETLYGTIAEKKNVAVSVYRYLKTMKRNVTSCWDGRRYYVYGEDRNEAGYTCVYDSLYEFWSVETGIRPAKFFVDDGSVYYAEYGTGDIRKFQKGKVTDSEVVIDQFISSKDIDGGAPFLRKGISEMNAFFENKNQKAEFVLSNRTHSDSFSKAHTINHKERESGTALGYNNVGDQQLIPLFTRIPLKNDMANIWRWSLENKGTNGFYLNQIEIGVTFPDVEDSTNIDL